MNNKKSLRKLFLENITIRNLVYFNTLLIAGALLPLYLYIVVYLCLLSYETFKEFPKEKVNGRLVQVRGVVDKKVDAFIDKTFKDSKKLFKKIKNLIIPKKEIDVIDLHSELIRETKCQEQETASTKEEIVNNVEQINKRLQEMNINGSIVRDPKEIAKEKEEYLSLLKILQEYQGADNKETKFNNTPVPTIEINNDHDGGYSYMKK